LALVVKAAASRRTPKETQEAGRDAGATVSCMETGYQGRLEGVIFGCEEEGCMRVQILPSTIFEGKLRRAFWAPFLALVFLAVGYDAPARCQEPASGGPSVTDAARKAREQQANAGNHAKVITNDDLIAPASAPNASAGAPKEDEATSTPAATAAATPATTTPAATAEKTGCESPAAERIAAELQSAQGERDQIRSDLSTQTKVISDGDVDLTNFKEGSSGVAFGSPPMSQAKPQSPARVAEAELNDKIAGLKEALRVACAPKDDAGKVSELGSAEQQLKLLQQELELDRSTYYSKTNYSADTAGKAKLDAEQQQIDSLQAEIAKLKEELSAPKTE
jgi:hypothetical protein